ncbi:PEP-CTERM sorting domain-containing protein [Kiritimatiellaeota bacterium B1221]|nr:PEP-CTERM sorting domain-containing protein [Kiritimatiellaeota bacterium B1221]
MRKLSLFIYLMSLCLICTRISAATIQINFGGSSGLTDWNEAGNGSGSNISDLKDSNSVDTGISLTWTDNLGNNGTSATSSPTSPASNLFPGAVTRRYAYGSGSDASTLGVFELGNLDENTLYTLHIFATRNTSENRVTRYTVTGNASETQSLGIGNNLDTYLTFSNLSPDSSDEIEVSFYETGVNQYSYISGMVIETALIPETSSLMLMFLGISGMLLVWKRKRQ